MNILKKSIVTFLIIALLSSVCVFSASSLTISDNNFDYQINYTTEEAVIVGCRTDSPDLVVPSHFSSYKITGIRSYAFEKCTTMETLTLPLTITSIGNYAFKDCTSLKYITIPENVTLLGEGFCSGCTALEKATVNAEGIGSVPKSAFLNCSALQSVTLNQNISTIGQSAFSGCTSLNSIVFSDSIETINRVAFYKSGIEAVEINDKITSIYDYTFAECPNLSSVIIPQTVTFIDPTAFSNDNNLTIFCYYQSYAHKYAVENNIPYIATANFMLGDVDGVDGININDVTAIQSHLAELKTVEGIYLLAADANQDDIVDISDATAIQMKLAEYELPYPIGQYVTQEIVSE